MFPGGAMKFSFSIDQSQFLRTCSTLAVGLLFCGHLASNAGAKSPQTIMQGKALFERTWTPRSPQLGSDGLGPLFNGNSCVACHNQGGTGGGGDAKFNAKTIGIEQLQVTGTSDPTEVATMVKSFHPGFVLDDGSVINTFTMPHHGGSATFQKWNQKILSTLNSEFSESGGSANASEVRHSNATPILFTNKIDNHNMTLRARVFQRNTTPLFGAGLIDAVKEEHLKEQFIAQKKHPEISGRPATLRTGSIGKFGWRGNVHSLLQFVDQACANEVGLETKRKPQGRDPMYRDYHNPSVDISDDQIRAMRDFISALPVPVRKIPSDTESRAIIARGEQAFHAIGCAVCHVPNMGPANGIYSDLLLHEMGNESIDLNHAEPYIKTRDLVKSVNYEQVTTTTNGSMGAYYGETTQITTPRSPDDFQVTDRTMRTNDPTASNRLRVPRSLRSRTNDRVNRNRILRSNFVFAAPTAPSRASNLVLLDRTELINRDVRRISNTSGSTSENTPDRFRGLQIQEDILTSQVHLAITYERTRFNEEWRTPPLWGVADSAPYMHDGRAETLLEAITLHEGEAGGTRDRFLNLSLADRKAIVAFLKTMVAPPNAPVAPVATIN